MEWLASPYAEVYSSKSNTHRRKIVPNNRMPSEYTLRARRGKTWPLHVQYQPNLPKGAPGVECQVAESKINNISELPLTSSVMDSEAVKTRALCAELLPRARANIILKGIFWKLPAQLPSSSRSRWLAAPFRPPFDGSKSIGREAKSRHAPCISHRDIRIITHHFCINPTGTHAQFVQNFPKSR